MAGDSWGFPILNFNPLRQLKISSFPFIKQRSDYENSGGKLLTTEFLKYRHF